VKSSISAGLFALNAFLCWPLFRIEYLDQFQSNEGSWIAFAKFLRENWPHVSWFPWFNAGMPFEDTYLPGVSALVAVVSMVGHCSAAHAIHFVAALAYSLAPVFLFLFAREVSGRIAPSALAALLWSLVSPSIIFPTLFRDLNTHFGLRRLRNIVVFGETPHNVALCLLPIALLLTWRYLERPSARRFALAALAAAGVMVMNAFGITVFFISSLMLFATRTRLSWKAFGSVVGIEVAAYLVLCRFLPPSLIHLLSTNLQTSRGDYRLTMRTIGFSACLVASLAVLWAATRFLSNTMLQFGLLVSACFGGITALYFMRIGVLPEPVRYHLEMELGVCLAAGFLIGAIPRRLALAAMLIGIAPLAWLGIRDWNFSRRLIHPADIAQSLPFREARWIATNLPGQRVLVSSQSQFLFNLFADNPQLSAGHDPSAPNPMQLLAIHMIYTGQNAGAKDGPISILWLQAFGCGAIVVAGRDSDDHFHAVANPDKFDGLLRLLWRESGESIYQVPQRTSSLAHVISRSAVVRTRPKNGLDVAELGRYVDALESAAMPLASIVWENPDHARINAKKDSSQVISVQMTYDPGWEARMGDRKVTTSADKLGLILIDAPCEDCSIDLEFTGGLERKVTLGVSLVMVLALCAMLLAR
jgi:hypothetical protein